MIPLHPIPESDHACPRCAVKLVAQGWYIPGMRNLADLKCPNCNRLYFGDLPVGHGLYYPMLLDRTDGFVYDSHGVEFFSKLLRNSYSNRVSSKLDFQVETFKAIKNALLLNCMDFLYGHSLTKLLNAQYYLDNYPDIDLIVLVPRFLRWLVPEGVAAIWTVNLPLARGAEWNDWLAIELRRLIQSLGSCHLSLSIPNPHPTDFNIERFTRLRPFPINEWVDRLARPTVTFVWREDRIWSIEDNRDFVPPVGSVKNYETKSTEDMLKQQRLLVVKLAETLRHLWPKLRFSVVGLGVMGRFPDWIVDMRKRTIDETTERIWCDQYVNSHVVIGIHGSNMLLPSAHAGTIIDLMPEDRWGNLGQDVLMNVGDVRELMCRCIFVPISNSPSTISAITSSLLRELPEELLQFKKPWCDHRFIRENLHRVKLERQKIVEGLSRHRQISIQSR